MRRILVLALLLATVAGCAVPGAFGASSGGSASQANSPTPGTVTEVTVAMGYIPNVQFAPFFVADKKGYFQAEGLKVKYQWGFEVDGVKLVGANQIDFAIVAGDQVIQARAQGIPIVYVANWYNAYPIEIISLKDKNIASPQDLVGKKVGMPCLCGATYTAWRALLYTQKIDASRVDVQNIGFTQVKALTQGTVDAVGVYANNEPVQLKTAGKDINEIQVWKFAQLVGNGIATNEKTVQERPDLVRRFVRALTRSIADSIANPDQALQISAEAVPEIGGANLQSSDAVLKASIPLWQSARIGSTQGADWEAMEKFMREAGFIQQDVDVKRAFTNDLVP